VADQQINISTNIIPFNPTEVTKQIFGANVLITRFDVEPVRGSLPNEEVYDWLIGSSGVAALSPAEFHHRSLRFTPSPEFKHSVPSFFTGTTNDLTSKLNAFVRLNYNSDIDLDVFFTYAGAPGAITWDAYFWTIDAPPGTLEPPLINTPYDFAYLEAILLNTKGDKTRRYLIVGLALP